MVVPTSHYTQKILLSVDAGSKTIGISSGTKRKELLAEEVNPRNDVVDNLFTRREFRKARRNRKTRYRKPGTQQAQGMARTLCGGQDSGTLHGNQADLQSAPREESGRRDR